MEKNIPKLSEIASELETLNGKGELPNTIVLLLKATKGYFTSILVEKINDDKIFKILSKHPAYIEELETLLDLITRYIQNPNFPSIKESELEDNNTPVKNNTVSIRI